MATKVSLNEAATFLGVSKATLRNWDNDGKLTAVRNPLNGYRQYDLDELVSLKKSVQGESAIKKEHLYNESVKNTSTKDIRRVVNKLHNIIRDNDANSNIVTRFDEISKLLFLRLMGGKELFADCNLRENNIAAEKIKDEYSNLIRQAGKQIPSKFCHIMLTDEAINACGKELYNVEIDESNVDIKGLAYEDTIRGTFDKSDNQQFFTPYQIVDFMVDCLKEYLHGKICDPACGTAGFLIKAAKFNHESVIGIEVDERLAWVSTLNLLLHGEEDFNIVCLDKGGSLSEAATLYFNTMDVILTNPPFGSDYTDKTILDRFVLGKNRSSRRRGILFIEQAWNLLQEGGFVAIIIDQGVLNSSTNTDVREYILSHFLIKGIIDLPESAFLPYANVSSSILILQKKAGNVRQGKTFFAKSLNIGRKSNGDDDINYSPSGEEKLNSDLPEILADWYRYLNGNYNMQYSKCYVAEIE